MNESLDGEVFTEVCSIVHRVCGIDVDSMTPRSNLLDDFYIDSLDFLEVSYEIDFIYKIRLPVEDWIAEIAAGEADVADYFVLARLVEQIKARLVGRDSDSAATDDS